MQEEEKQKNIKGRQSFLKSIDNYLIRFQRIPVSEKIFFIQHLGVMLKASISLTKALKALSRQTKNKRLRKIISDVYEHVNKGGTLADGLRAHGDAFDDLFVNMIAAGEASGTLEEVLKNLYQQLKKNHELVSKIRGALTYPVIVLFAMGAIGTGVIVYVVPKFITIFEEVEMELPLMTRALISVSGFVSQNGLMAAAIIVTGIIIFIKIIKTGRGRQCWHFLILKMPIISPIVKKINLARFARTLSSLLKTDIKIVESFQITAKTLGNIYYQKSLNEAAEKVKKGELIHKIFEEYPDLYNHVVVEMIAVGEETGELDSILEEIAGFYDAEIKEVMNTLPSIIEPLVILVLAAAIGAMAVAIIMPMYSLTNAI